MKRLTFMTTVTVIMLTAFSASAQTLLLDSLKGSWIMAEQYNNKIRIQPKGTIEFREDGIFESDGSYFGTATGLYRTDESRSAIHIEINGKTSEWTATVHNHVLRMVRPRKKNMPRVELVLLSENAEFNSGGR